MELRCFNTVLVLCLSYWFTNRSRWMVRKDQCGDDYRLKPFDLVTHLSGMLWAGILPLCFFGTDCCFCCVKHQQLLSNESERYQVIFWSEITYPYYIRSSDMFISRRRAFALFIFVVCFLVGEGRREWAYAQLLNPRIGNKSLFRANRGITSLYFLTMTQSWYSLT